jgi:hypothetical protein
MAKKTVYDVTPEQVVEVWERSESAPEAAEKLKMPKDILLARISNYRALGIKLKSMPRQKGRKGLNIAKLNKLIESVHREQGKEDGPGPEESPPQPASKKPEATASVVKEMLDEKRRAKKPAST